MTAYLRENGQTAGSIHAEEQDNATHFFYVNADHLFTAGRRKCQAPVDPWIMLMTSFEFDEALLTV